MDELGLPTGKLHTVRYLIHTLRRLGQSKNRFVRQVGTVLATSVLDRRLAGLTDRQIGQLMFDEVGCDFPVFQPETAILQQATLRLFRSANGLLSREDIASLRRCPPCQKCGNGMLLHYGIDEPDFYKCFSLRCGHKQFIGDNIGGYGE